MTTEVDAPPVNLMETSREFFRRPADEQCTSFADAQLRAALVKAESHEVTVPSTDVVFLPDPKQPAKVVVSIGGADPVGLGHYFMTRVASETAIAPDLFRRVEPLTLAQVLNESWQHVMAERDTKSVAFLVRSPAGGMPYVRCVTSDQYGRLWDADLLGEIERGLLPAGFIPAIPTCNTSSARKDGEGKMLPALFLGDRSSHFFFYGDQGKGLEDGFGGLRRGLVINNSEVGARKFTWTTFYFREVCANFIIWDVTKVKRARAIHKKNAVQIGIDQFREDVRGLSNEVSALAYDKLSIAQLTDFVTGRNDDERYERAIERLRLMGTTKDFAERALTAASLPENVAKDNPWSLFSIAQGVTWAARMEAHADAMIEMAAIGGKILNLVEKS